MRHLVRALNRAQPLGCQTHAHRLVRLVQDAIFVVPRPVVLLTLSHWKTVHCWMQWSPIYQSTQSSFSACVSQRVCRPRLRKTFLSCPQSHVQTAPLLLQSCLTGPLDALRVSAFLVTTTATTPTSDSCATGVNRMVLSPSSHHSC